MGILPQALGVIFQVVRQKVRLCWSCQSCAVLIPALGRGGRGLPSTLPVSSFSLFIASPTLSLPLYLYSSSEHLLWTSVNHRWGEGHKDPSDRVLPHRSLESSDRERDIQVTKMQVENGTCHEKPKIVECEECHEDAQLLGYLPRASQVGPQWGRLDSETWFYWGTHRSSGPWVWSVLIPEIQI